MASLYPNSQYICGTCIRHLSRRSATVPSVQSRQFSPTSETQRPTFSLRERDRMQRRLDSSIRKTRFLPGKLERMRERMRYPLGKRVTPRKVLYIPKNEHVFPWDIGTSLPRKMPYTPKNEHVSPWDVGKEDNKEAPISSHTVVPSKPSRLIPSEPTSFIPAKPLTHQSLHFGTFESFNWYWETVAPTIAQKAQANHFFTHTSSAQFLRSAALFRQFPESDVPEIAFVGRSNVGKSSLLNAIVNTDVKELLARTSKTPGFTKTMNLYGIGGQDGIRIRAGRSGSHDKIVGIDGLTIVDMPGYGEGSLSSWGVEIMKYLQSRKQLRRVFVLIDAQHGVKEKDRSLLASLRLGGVSHQVILSKVDRVYIPEAKSLSHFSNPKEVVKPVGSANSLKLIMHDVRSEIQPLVGSGALGELLACSSEVQADGRRLGIDSIRFAMLQAIGHNFGRNKKNLVRTMKTDAKPKSMKTHAKPKSMKNLVRTMKTDAKPKSMKTHAKPKLIRYMRIRSR